MNKNVSKPKRKFSIFNFQLSILLLLAATVLLTACPSESIDPDNGGEDPGGNTENPVEYVMKPIALTGKVTGATGAALSGVRVTTGTATATTAADGTFTLNSAGTIGNRAVVRLEKDGYFALVRSAGADTTSIHIDAMMSPRGNSANSVSATFPASEAKTIEAGGVKIELPANAFATADGKAYTGTVNADVIYFAPDNPNVRRMMPGGDLATDKTDEMMLPAGMADAVFTAADGKPLQIAKDREATVTYALPAGANTAGMPATLPLWTFDEARGYWKEDGTATLRGNAYTATATHFSPGGVAKKFKRITIEIFAYECDGKPAVGAAVHIDVAGVENEDDALAPLSRDEYEYDNVTNAGGYCKMFAPAFNTLRITCTYNGKMQNQFVTVGDDFAKHSLVFEFKDDCEEDDDPDDPEDPDDETPRGFFTVDGRTYNVEGGQINYIWIVDEECGNTYPFVEMQWSTDIYVQFQSVPVASNGTFDIRDALDTDKNRCWLTANVSLVDPNITLGWFSTGGTLVKNGERSFEFSFTGKEYQNETVKSVTGRVTLPRPPF
ncbi:MAG: hypothetical protein LBE56_03800 [Tannerella sp.]|nr:hypothetical protein [Tannerella sp.]